MNDNNGHRDAQGFITSGYAGQLLLLVAAGTMLCTAGRLVLSPLLPWIIDDLGISSSQGGFALTVLWGCTAVCRYPGGRLADELSRKTVLIGALLLAILGLSTLAFARGFPLFLLGAVFLGTGFGLYFPAAIALLSDLFVERRGQAFTVHEAFINLGGIISGLLATATISVTSWNGAFLPIVLALLGVGTLLSRRTDGKYVISMISFNVASTGKRIGGSDQLRLMLIAFALIAFVWQAVTTFLPTFLQVEKGMSSTMANNAYAGFFVVGVVANLLVGPIVNRIGSVKVGIGSATLATVGFGMLLVADGVYSVLVTIVILASGLTLFWPSMTAFVMTLFPNKTIGGDYGAFSTMYLVVGSGGPFYVGLAADTHSYRIAFFGLLFCFITSLTIIAMMMYRS